MVEEYLFRMFIHRWVDNGQDNNITMVEGGGIAPFAPVGGKPAFEMLTISKSTKPLHPTPTRSTTSTPHIAPQLTHSITSPWDGHPNFPPVFNLLSSSQCKTPRVFHLFPLFFSTISGLRELTRLTVLSQVWPDSLLLLAAWWSSRTVARCGCVERWSTCHTLAAVRVPPHA